MLIQCMSRSFTVPPRTGNCTSSNLTAQAQEQSADWALLCLCHRRGQRVPLSRWGEGLRRQQRRWDVSYSAQDTAQQGASAPDFCTNSTMGALVKGVGKPGCNLLPFVTAFSSLTSNHNVLCHGGHSQSSLPELIQLWEFTTCSPGQGEGKKCLQSLRGWGVEPFTREMNCLGSVPLEAVSSSTQLSCNLSKHSE